MARNQVVFRNTWGVIHGHVAWLAVRWWQQVPCWAEAVWAGCLGVLVVVITWSGVSTRPPLLSHETINCCNPFCALIELHSDGLAGSATALRGRPPEVKVNSALCTYIIKVLTGRRTMKIFRS
jgi:hypothetical protein